MPKSARKRRPPLTIARPSMVGLADVLEGLTIRDYNKVVAGLNDSELSFGCNSATLVEYKRFQELVYGALPRAKADAVNKRLQRAAVKASYALHVWIPC